MSDPNPNRKYHMTVGLRQPNRKVRLGVATEQELNDVASAMSSASFTELHGTTKAGSIIVIPASNVAYVEATPVDDKVTV